MQEVLFGRIVDLKEADVDVKDIKWQTKGMKKQIKKAYYNFVLRYHPDMSEGNPKLFIKGTECYQKL